MAIGSASRLEIDHFVPGLEKLETIADELGLGAAQLRALAGTLTAVLIQTERGAMVRSSPVRTRDAGAPNAQGGGCPD
jgi:hypothetical protein